MVDFLTEILEIKVFLRKRMLGNMDPIVKNVVTGKFQGNICYVTVIIILLIN